jgi:hypothetical protein
LFRGVYHARMSRDAFEGDDEVVNIENDSEESLKLNMETEVPAEDVIEPKLDE